MMHGLKGTHSKAMLSIVIVRAIFVASRAGLNA